MYIEGDTATYIYTQAIVSNFLTRKYYEEYTLLKNRKLNYKMTKFKGYGYDIAIPHSRWSMQIGDAQFVSKILKCLSSKRFSEDVCQLLECENMMSRSRTSLYFFRNKMIINMMCFVRSWKTRLVLMWIADLLSQ